MAARSFKQINYSTRPAKTIERKMLAEALSRLAPFGAVADYRYIGFGGTFFSDFVLFHRALNITRLISIERLANKRQRFELNQPFRCIQLDFRESNDALPRLPWDIRTIAWLDYDSKLTNSVLFDARMFASNAVPGSVLILTVNVHPGKYDEPKVDPLKKRIVDMDKVPTNLQDKDLEDWGLSDVSRKIITNEILETLGYRSAGGATDIRYQQLFHFRYRDNARMLTVGGILYDEGQTHLLHQCAFDRLEFYRPDDEAFEIPAPNLTLREIRHLDRRMPAPSAADVFAPGIPERDIEDYMKVYRYFPAFVDAEL